MFGQMRHQKPPKEYIDEQIKICLELYDWHRTMRVMLHDGGFCWMKSEANLPELKELGERLLRQAADLLPQPTPGITCGGLSGGWYWNNGLQCWTLFLLTVLNSLTVPLE